MKSPNLSSKRGERGVLTIAFAMMIIGLMAFAGMAIDVGYMQWEKRRIQSAADAAAMGALRELELSKTDLSSAGKNDASLNGFTDGQNNTTVTINNPPTSGHYSGNSAAVEAIVTRQIPTFFMRIFGQNGITASARAVARTTPTEGSIGACVFVLNPTTSAALEIGGTSLNLSTQCGIVVNSTDSSALKVDSGVQVQLGNHAQVGVVGPSTGSGWVINGQAQLIDSTTGKSESPVNVPKFLDPLANVVAPTPSTVTPTIKGNDFSVKQSQMPAGNSVDPGIYCGGISVQSTTGTLTFNPGVYILAGGGLTINGGTVSGSGVTFYNTDSPSWGCGNKPYSPVQISGNAQVNLSAPTSGDTAGVLFFQDRSINGNSNSITGTSDSTYDGALYFRNSQLKFAGTSSTNGYLVLVSDTMMINGGGTLGNNHSNLSVVYTVAPFSTGGGLVE